MTDSLRTHILAAMTAAAFAMAVPAAAQQYEEKLSVRPIGRALFDGALYLPSGPLYDTPDGAGPRFADGVAIPDVRLGAKASYGHWRAKVDVGFAYQKLSFKDVYIRYDINPENYLQGGYFSHQFGLNTASSSSRKPSMESDTGDEFFASTERNLGITYVHDRGRYFAGVSGIVDRESMSHPANEQGKVSVAASTRLVYRPWHSTGRVVQAGLSFWIQSALHTVDADGNLSPGYFSFSTNFPTRVNKIEMLSARIDNARSLFKFSPELLLADGRLALESQFYLMNISRRASEGSTSVALPAYQAHGAYAMLRGLICGEAYTYQHDEAGLATPDPRSLELVAAYSYTDATSTRAGIYGGRSHDASLTLNYYINSYVTARLRYSYTHVADSEILDLRTCRLNTIQARIQFLF